MTLILASSSPRRRELLAELNIPFRVVPPIFYEYSRENLSVAEEVQWLAKSKLQSLISRFPGATMLACDTLVSFQGQKLGKAESPEHARAMLQKLSASMHEVWTGLALYSPKRRSIIEACDFTKVFFRPLSSQVIESYIASGEYQGKAGACSIQGRSAEFIDHIEGEIDTVEGLPLKLLVALLSRMGF